MTDTERQDQIPAIREVVSELAQHLKCAETCENVADLLANIQEALGAARQIVAALKEIE